MKELTNIRKQRMMNFLTQKELAKKAGVKPCSICCLEQRGIRRRSVAERYARILGCEPEDLLVKKSA